MKAPPRGVRNTKIQVKCGFYKTELIQTITKISYPINAIDFP